MRLVLLPGTPVSTDIFRYVWDGRVQGAGINPYLHLPVDAALSSLRDADIYPHINRADYAPTIYPPTSQIVFYLITRISETTVAMKAAMVAFEGLAVWAILQLLAARGLPRSRILLYAWHPLPLWEFARSGHVDIVAIAFLLLAFLAIERRSPILAGIALGAGVLVKYFPIVAGPALYKRWDWRLPIAFLATIAVLYLPYIGAGAKVLGFLGQYVGEEGFDKGSGIFLWQLLDSVLPLRGQAFAFYFPAAALDHGGARALRRHARPETRRRSRRRDAARRRFHHPALAALHLVLRVAGAVPVLPPRHRRGLSDLRSQLSLFRALAAQACRTDW